ncbi:MAG: hypothetical protein HC831_02170 [Chloroflexia bacterium]|nr:hypothetical protein [Chloroflexia bacterium]
MDKRVIKKEVNSDDLNLDGSFIPLYGVGWRNPKSVSLRNFLNIIRDVIGISETEAVTEVVEHDEPIELPIGLKPVDPSNIATDGSYLYVKADDKWRRVPLSEF